MKKEKALQLDREERRETPLPEHLSIVRKGSPVTRLTPNIILCWGTTRRECNFLSMCPGYWIPPCPQAEACSLCAKLFQLRCGFDSWIDNCPLESEWNVKAVMQKVTKSCHLIIVIDFYIYISSSLRNILTVKYRVIAYFLSGRKKKYLFFIPCARISFLYSFLTHPRLAIVI